jgi:transposase
VDVPSPIPYEDRREIVRRKGQGQSLRAVAEDLGYSYWGVRKLWRQYRDQGEEGLRTGYRRGPGPVRSDRGIYVQAMAWKGEHASWGAGLIRSMLQQRWPEKEIPHERTLQRWWERGGINTPRRRRKLGYGKLKRAVAVHETWQTDGVEVNGCSWITVTDEKSGAVLAAHIFPLQTSRPDSPARGSDAVSEGLCPVGNPPAHPGG